MDDLISRQDVIDFLQITRDSEYKKSISAEVKHKSVIRSKHDAHVAFCDYLIECVKQLPTHPTPSNTLDALDCVERQAAIELVRDVCDAIMSGCESWYDPETGDEVYKDIREVDAILKCNKEVRIALRNMPSAQPRKGKWIRTRTMTHDGELYCDQCEQEHPEQKIIWNFCPNCGCRMEEGDSE